VIHPGRLFLLPTPIAQANQDSNLTPEIKVVCSDLTYFAVENVRSARRFLSQIKIPQPIEELQFVELNKKTTDHEVDDMIQPILNGRNCGLLSEAGCPGIAVPGSKLVFAAHQFGIQVVPLVGPSSITLALMASGFNGQSFAFHGYVPIDKKALKEFIKKIETQAAKTGQTQIFMDTPYRNEKLFLELQSSLRPDSWLSVARDITGSEEMVLTKQVYEWKSKNVALHKMPTMFLVWAE